MRLAISERIRHEFWKRFKLEELNPDEWEALCDGCGLCCLFKFTEENDHSTLYTKVACRLLDCSTCQCKHYEARKKIVKDCVKLTADNFNETLQWLPKTCAYKLVYQGKPLYDWHYLISEDPITVHTSGISVKDWAVSETVINLNELENYIVQDIET